MAFHAGSTGSNPVRGIRDFRDSGAATPTKPPHSGHRSRVASWVWTLGLCVLLLVAWGMYEPRPADASYRPAPPRIVTAAHTRMAPAPATAARFAWVICRVWPRQSCTAALNVAWCESSLRPWARNGQYVGLFQMGSSERARFGHHRRNPWVQARAALRYYWLSGWSPWQCRPGTWA